MDFMDISLGWLLLIFVLFYVVGKVIYNLKFHPLAHVPGPRLAAITHWYHSYYHAIKQGTFVPYILPELHKKYGPVVRFSPDEVDVHDVHTYNAVFARGAASSFHKDLVYFGAFGTPRSSAILVGAEWRARRALLTPMFNRTAITELTPRAIYPFVQKLCGLLDGFCARAQPVPLDSAMYCLTVDVITAYVSGKPWNMLDEPGLDTERLELIRWFTAGSNFPVCFPWTRKIVQTLNKLFPRVVLGGFTEMFLASRAIVEAASKQEDVKPDARSVLHRLLHPDARHTRPPFDDLVDETMLLIAAGGDTSANALQFAFYKLCKLPEARARVREELSTLKRDPDTNQFDALQLEALPYLTGFIKETLRYYYGAVGRQPRIVPNPGLNIASAGIFLPAGTRLSCSIKEYHMDPSLFERPTEFQPERWMGERGKALQPWLLSFGRGDRMCLGMHLAYREIYVVVAEVLERYEMELFETSDRDMEVVDHLATASRGRMKVMLRRRDER